MTDVPSNLIPTRITQLPEYEGDSTEGYTPYAVEGRTYKAKLANIVAPLADDVAIAAAAAEAARDAALVYKFNAEDSALAAAASAAEATTNGAEQVALARAWAEGTEPGGPNTDSSKGWSYQSQGFALSLETDAAGGFYDSLAAGVADPAVEVGDAFNIIEDGRHYVGQKTGPATGEIIAEYATTGFAATINGPGGAGEVGTVDGSNVQNALSAIQKPQRDLFNSLSAMVGQLPTTCVIERRRTDYIEFAAYTPLTADGLKWHRWYFSNRFNAGFLAAPTFINCHLALLYSSAAVPIFAATGSGGISAASPTSTSAASGATRTGTWVGPSTVSGVANTYYTTTLGDSITYTISCNAGDVVYSAHASVFTNGGIVAVSVTTGGSPIAAGDYLCPLGGTGGTERVFSTRQDNGTLGVAAMFRAPSTGSYVVTLQLATNTPASSRLYTTRLDAYAALTGTSAAGCYGSVTVPATPGGNANLTYHPGHTFVIAYNDCTRIDWSYWKTATSGQVSFKVYNSAGVEVTGLTTTDLDMYNSSSVVSSVEVMSGKPKDDYKLHVFFKNTKNASSTDYRLYWLESRASDETTAGVPGTDTFNILDCPPNPAGGVDFGSYQLMGPSNMNFAIKGRVAAQPAGTEKFLSGPAHGFETSPTDWALMIDGVDQTAVYNAMAVGGMLPGVIAKVAYTTTLKSPTTTQTTTPTSSVTLAALPTMGALSYEDCFSAAGYRFTGDVDWSADVVIYRDYGAMMQVYSRKSGTKGIGGGFDKLAVSSEGNYTLSTYNNAEFTFDATADELAFVNDTHAVAVKVLNRAEINSYFRDFTGTAFGNCNSYSSGYNKAYSDVVASFPAGKQFGASDGYRKQLLFRAFEGPAMQVVAGF